MLGGGSQKPACSRSICDDMQGVFVIVLVVFLSVVMVVNAYVVGVGWGDTSQFL